MLLLYTEPRLTPAIVALDARLRSLLEAGSPAPLTFYTEYLDLNLFDGSAPQPELRALLQRKYAARPIDLIVAGGSRALRVALQNRADLFSGAPVVFIAVDRSAAADLRLDADVTGTWLHLGWAETLDLARRLQPEIRRAIVVNGTSPADRVWLAQSRQQLGSRREAIEVAYLTDRPLEDILKEVAALPAGTIVLLGSILRDSAGRDLSQPETFAQVAAAASVPVYGLSEPTVGTGIVGGYVVSFDAHGKVAAELALRLLAGGLHLHRGEGRLPEPRQVRPQHLGGRTLPVSRLLARWLPCGFELSAVRPWHS